MPVLSSNDVSQSYRGLHLFHFGMSNCSQRVRMVLEEKGLPWTGHHVDLMKMEHVTGENGRLSPHGVVPTLIDDGRIIYESHDIISYLDEHYPETSFAPSNPQLAAQIEDLMQRSAALQDDVKLLTFTIVFGDAAKKSEEELAVYAEHQTNAELVEWHRKLAHDAFTADEIDQAILNYHSYLEHLESILRDSPWLSGDAFGLGDISCLVQWDRACLLNAKKPGLFDLDAFPRCTSWFERIRERPSYHKAIVAYWPKPVKIADT